jgi:hypothetical protein
MCMCGCFKIETLKVQQQYNNIVCSDEGLTNVGCSACACLLRPLRRDVKQSY